MAFFLIVYIIIASNYTIIYHLCKSRVQFDEKLDTFVTLLESIYGDQFSSIFDYIPLHLYQLILIIIDISISPDNVRYSNYYV